MRKGSLPCDSEGCQQVLGQQSLTSGAGPVCSREVTGRSSQPQAESGKRGHGQQAQVAAPPPICISGPFLWGGHPTHLVGGKANQHVPGCRQDGAVA